MSNVTKEQYKQQQASCENLCLVPVTKVQEQTGELPCVCCPFCNEIVNALLTKTTISCPQCKITVNRT